MVAEGGAIHPREVRAGDPHVAFSTARIFDHATPFDPESMKVVAARMMREFGVDLLLHSFFVDAIVEDDTLKGVIVANKSGLQAIEARVVVDCTGDGDVAARAGAPVVQGRDEDGLVQPSTMFFRIKGVDKARYHAYVRETNDNAFRALFAQARANGDISFQRELAVVLEQPRGDEWRVNCTRILGVDGTNVEDLTRAEIEGREQVQQLVRFFRRYVPGFERCTLVDTGAQVGVRETRRIVGEYTIQTEDVLHGTPFEDVVLFCAYPPDLHSPTHSGHTQVGQMTANAYQIPYRALVPQRIDGLLAAGRCVSSTHEALSAIRSHGTVLRHGPGRRRGSCLIRSDRCPAAQPRGPPPPRSARRAGGKPARRSPFSEINPDRGRPIDCPYPPSEAAALAPLPARASATVGVASGSATTTRCGCAGLSSFCVGPPRPHNGPASRQRHRSKPLQGRAGSLAHPWRSGR